MKNTIIIFVCLFILLGISSSLFISEAYKNASKPRIDIVIARYNEDLDWLCDEEIKTHLGNPDFKTSIYIYNKGINNVTAKFLECYKTLVDLHVIQLPNEGRCDHTYLFHIINNYTSLANVTIFLPASCNMEWKNAKTRYIIRKAYTDIDTVFIEEQSGNVYETMKDFSLSSWLSSHESNKINTDDKMKLAEPRPFGPWFMHVYGEEDKQYGSMTYHGILAISRKHILGRDINFYKNLITHVEGHHNPEAGHYMERSWSVLFKVPDDRKFLSSLDR
jgi:hypothetical protein